MKPNPRSSRRRFIGRLGSGAAALAFRPLFSRNTLLSASPLAAPGGYIHLCYNENPYGPSEKALKAIRDSVAACGRYPADLTYESIKADLAKHHDVGPENILMGTGSTEILKLCDDVFLRDRPSLVAAETTYDAVYQYAVNSRASAVRVPMTKDHRHDLDRMARAITPEVALVFICNPNNPTGTIVTRDELRRFMDRIPDSAVVLIDEAYSHFAGREYESGIRYVKEGRKIVVARTFSKAYGLAGMRIGYAVAPEELLAVMRPFGLDFNLSVPSVAAARAALMDEQTLDRTVKLNDVQRQAFYADMKSAGFAVIPSQANFVMVDVRRNVLPVIEEFWKRKILVGREFGGMNNFLRVSIGTDEEMKKFYAAFRQILE